MSLKYKLSITIAGLLCIVMILCQLMWEFNQQKRNLEFLEQITHLASVQVSHIRDVYGDDMQNTIEKYYEQLKDEIPYLLGMVVERRDSNIVVGDYPELAAIEESIKSKQASLSSHEFQLKREEWEKDKLFISEYYTEEQEGSSIFLIYDRKQYKELHPVSISYYNVYIFVLFAVAFMICFWLIVRMLRPLKDILWKVNEVSLARFQKPILITTKDELGVIAFKINAMSQNLNIYMNKLKNSFDENRRMRLYVESFINHSTDAVYIMDITGKFVQVNHAFEELFEFSEAEIIGKRYTIIPDELIAEKNEVINRVKRGEVVEPLETFRKTKSGECIPVSTTINPIIDINQQLTGFINVCRDMRHRHRMEEIMRQAEKLNTVGQLAAGVAHEIRNPLTTLRGFLQLQKQSGKLYIDHVDVMLSELDRINLIVGEFLILSKPQAVKFKNRDIREIISEVCVLMNSEALMHNVIINEKYTLENTVIPCEANQLKQVFINLIKNAIEAMPTGGCVHISVQSDERYVTVSVTDEGIGMNEEVLERIGDPFFTAKENGTGLGIMVSQKIIHSHMGQIELSSEVNVGTTVKVILPLQDNSHYADASSL